MESIINPVLILILIINSQRVQWAPASSFKKKVPRRCGSFIKISGYPDSDNYHSPKQSTYFPIKLLCTHFLYRTRSLIGGKREFNFLREGIPSPFDGF
jgi:hypothetical protein